MEKKDINKILYNYVESLIKEGKLDDTLKDNITVLECNNLISILDTCIETLIKDIKNNYTINDFIDLINVIKNVNTSKKQYVYAVWCVNNSDNTNDAAKKEYINFICEHVDGYDIPAKDEEEAKKEYIKFIYRKFNLYIPYKCVKCKKITYNS